MLFHCHFSTKKMYLQEMLASEEFLEDGHPMYYPPVSQTTNSSTQFLLKSLYRKQKLTFSTFVSHNI